MVSVMRSCSFFSLFFIVKQRVCADGVSVSFAFRKPCYPIGRLLKSNGRHGSVLFYLTVILSTLWRYEKSTIPLNRCAAGVPSRVYGNSSNGKWHNDRTSNQSEHISMCTLQRQLSDHFVFHKIRKSERSNHKGIIRCSVAREIWSEFFSQSRVARVTSQSANY